MALAVGVAKFGELVAVSLFFRISWERESPICVRHSNRVAGPRLFLLATCRNFLHTTWANESTGG